MYLVISNPVLVIRVDHLPDGDILHAAGAADDRGAPEDLQRHGEPRPLLLQLPLQGAHHH